MCEHHPEIIKECVDRNWEFFSHGIYNTRYHWNFTPEEERAAMLESREIHRKLTGREQMGWFSPAITNTVNTFDLAAECGFSYTADLYHDDQPFPLNVKSGKLISMPYSVDLNDVIVHRKGEEADDFAGLDGEANVFDRLDFLELAAKQSAHGAEQTFFLLINAIGLR